MIDDQSILFKLYCIVFIYALIFVLTNFNFFIKLDDISRPTPTITPSSSRSFSSRSPSIPIGPNPISIIRDVSPVLEQPRVIIERVERESRDELGLTAPELTTPGVRNLDPMAIPKVS